MGRGLLTRSWTADCGSPRAGREREQGRRERDEEENPGLWKRRRQPPEGVGGEWRLWLALA